MLDYPDDPPATDHLSTDFLRVLFSLIFYLF